MTEDEARQFEEIEDELERWDHKFKHAVLTGSVGRVISERSTYDMGKLRQLIGEDTVISSIKVRQGETSPNNVGVVNVPTGEQIPNGPST